jgi:hypothetical protein
MPTPARHPLNNAPTRLLRWARFALRRLPARDWLGSARCCRCVWASIAAHQGSLCSMAPWGGTAKCAASIRRRHGSTDSPRGASCGRVPAGHRLRDPRCSRCPYGDGAYPAGHAWQSNALTVGLVLTLLGLTALQVVLTDSGDRLLARLGTIAYLVGVVLWIVDAIDLGGGRFIYESSGTTWCSHVWRSRPSAVRS